MPERRPPPSRAPQAPIQVSREAARDTLARIRPGLFVRTFLQELESRGEGVLARLFKMATDESVPDAVALGAIDRILQLSNAKDIMAVALGLKQKRGRPGQDDSEERQQQEEWAQAIDLTENPPGSGQFE
jgi:hypothetical protein